MENHPFDRIDPAANDIGVNKSIHDAIPYCPHCGKELVSEGTVGDRVFYK